MNMYHYFVCELYQLEYINPLKATRLLIKTQKGKPNLNRQRFISPDHIYIYICHRRRDASRRRMLWSNDEI